MYRKIKLLCKARASLHYLEGCCWCASNISTFDLHFEGLESCQRKFCKACLQFFIQMISSDRDCVEGNPNCYPCDQCQIPVNLAYFCTIFDLTDPLEMKQLLGLAPESIEEIEEETKEKQCNICYTQYSSKLMKHLPCDHQFCNHCLAQHFGVKIREGNTSLTALNCPECGEPCGFKLLYEVLSQDDYKKLINFSLKAKETEGIEAQGGDLIVTCPFCSQHQDKIFFVTKKELKFSTVQKCRECKNKFCVLCKEQHGRKTSCEEHKRRKKEEQADIQMEQLKIKEGLIECPKCGIVTERAQGCYFMTCQSLRCRGRTKFCGICGKHLDKDYLHFAHFPQGPFIRKCNTTEGKEDPEERDYQYT